MAHYVTIKCENNDESVVTNLVEILDRMLPFMFDNVVVTSDESEGGAITGASLSEELESLIRESISSQFAEMNEAQRNEIHDAIRAHNLVLKWHGYKV